MAMLRSRPHLWCDTECSGKDHPMRAAADVSQANNKPAMLASYLALAAAGLFWGFGFVFGKYALADMPVAAMITYRFAIASLVLVPVLFWRRIRILPSDFFVFAVAGL